nr:Rho GTPase protein rac1 [Polyrhizophydium stewartii]
MPHLPLKTVVVGDGLDNYLDYTSYNGMNIQIYCWDTGGGEDYWRLRPLSYPGTSFFLLCFSIASPASFANVETYWKPELTEHASDVPVILVGTCVDLRVNFECQKRLREEQQYPVTFTQGEQMAEKIGAVRYMECSAMTGDGVDAVFEAGIATCYNKFDTVCPHCRINFPTCIASGRPIVESIHFMCHVCKHRAMEGEISGMSCCPLLEGRDLLTLAVALAGEGGPTGLLRIPGQLDWAQGRAIPMLFEETVRSGQLRVVQIIHQEALWASWTAETIDATACGRNTELVKWLVQTRPTSCTARAFAAAFANTDIAMLDFLRNCFPSEFAALTPETIEFARDISVLVWLKQHRPDLFTAKLLECTVEGGSVKAAIWLVNIGGIELTAATLVHTLAKNRPDVLKWMVTTKGFKVGTSAFGALYHCKNTHALEWLIHHENGSRAGVMVNKFAASGKDKLVNWMHTRFPGCVTQCTLEIAIHIRNPLLVSSLARNCLDDCGLNLLSARKLAAKTNADEKIVRALKCKPKGKTEKKSDKGSDTQPNAAMLLQQTQIAQLWQ